MKKVEVYVDSRGKYKKSKKALEKAETEYKIEEIQRKLHNFRTTVTDKIFDKGKSIPPEVSDILYECIVETVLRDFDNFAEVVAEGRALEKELDSLKSRLEYHPWWMKLKWW